MTAREKTCQERERILGEHMKKQNANLVGFKESFLKRDSENKQLAASNKELQQRLAALEKELASRPPK